LEFCDGGDLVAYQGNLKEKVYSLDKATTLLADVIRGLEHLHQQGYLHRDLKLQNILRSTIGGNEVCKLADFGFSKPQKDTGGTNLGTEQFKAPEIFASEQYGYSIDMWAFGVVLFFMLNREYPFSKDVLTQR
jgi:serine/threonine protein kinase